MKKTILIGSILIVCMLMMLPSISASQTNTGDADTKIQKVNIFEKIKEKMSFGSILLSILWYILTHIQIKLGPPVFV